MDILRRAVTHAGAVAVRADGVATSYGAVLALSEQLQHHLSSLLPRATGLDGPRVGIYAEAGVPYVASTWATWMAGGIAVPLATSHPPAELQYVLRDAGVSAVVCPEGSSSKLQDLTASEGVPLLAIAAEEVAAFAAHHPPDPHHDAAIASSSSNSSSSTAGTSAQWQQQRACWARDAGSLVIYTSGTTGRPKGALHTHGSLGAQVRCLVDAWRWQATDAILHALPLHHVHGIVNALHCAHYAGAAANFLPKFSPGAVWEELMSGDTTVFMGVPTMYSYLLQHWEDKLDPQQQEAAKAAAAGLRLTVSGSAACPVVLLERWRDLTGQTLLERYGMTETGMILSNPYEGERRPGYVGLPLAGVEVEVKLLDAAAAEAPPSTRSRTTGVNECASGGDAIGGCTAGDPPQATAAATTAAIAAAAAGGGGQGGVGRPAAPAAAAGEAAGWQGVVQQGELLVAGPLLFREYWGRPEATAAAFDSRGYFATGDIVELGGDPPYYRIMGRASADIIKHKGYKVSGLDVEGVLLQHPAIAEAAVLGLPHTDHGQAVAALVVLKPITGGPQQQPEQADLQQALRQWCSERLPSYQVPSVWLVRGDPLPRNAMGKVNKKQLVGLFNTYPATICTAARLPDQAPEGGRC